MHYISVICTEYCFEELKVNGILMEDVNVLSEKERLEELAQNRGEQVVSNKRKTTTQKDEM